ncbi:hypothetical protein CC86DRAFT_382606 [Ophiobolus disseminans]|uniref:Uncharacterized protein n=1 Tax=Ophiobolus disseminans TaxID=1469910 RepID=A0A6A6ZY02_9PLEO|nr:hypothetical protein CC86DRAFT_382606 [Ophiobolus disseminans]
MSLADWVLFGPFAFAFAGGGAIRRDWGWAYAGLESMSIGSDARSPFLAGAFPLLEEDPTGEFEFDLGKDSGKSNKSGSSLAGLEERERLPNPELPPLDPSADFGAKSAGTGVLVHDRDLEEPGGGFEVPGQLAL